VARREDSETRLRTRNGRKTLSAAAAFFAERKTWAGYTPMAVVGVVSDFSGPNEFFSQELLNLLARAGQHYRILRKDRSAAPRLEGLRAVIYSTRRNLHPLCGNRS
jgi:hypothetical protein